MNKMMDAYSVVVGKLVRKRQLGRPSHKWEYKVKMELQESEGTADCNDLSQDMNRWRALVNAVMNFQFV